MRYLPHLLIAWIAVTLVMACGFALGYNVSL